MFPHKIIAHKMLENLYLCNLTRQKRKRKTKTCWPVSGRDPDWWVLKQYQQGSGGPAVTQKQRTSSESCFSEVLISSDMYLTGPPSSSAIEVCETHHVCRRDDMTWLTAPLLAGEPLGGRLDGSACLRPSQPSQPPVVQSLCEWCSIHHSQRFDPSAVKFIEMRVWVL